MNRYHNYLKNKYNLEFANQFVDYTDGEIHQLVKKSPLHNITEYFELEWTSYKYSIQ